MMTNKTLSFLREALKLVEEGDFASLLVLSFFFYYGLDFITAGILKIHRVVYGYQGINDGEPRLLGSAVATIYLFAHFIWLSGDFNHGPEFFIVNGLRCFLAARILFAVCAVVATLFLIIKQRIGEMTKKTPAIGAAIGSAFNKFWSLFSMPSPPETEPEDLIPSQQEIYQQDMDDAQSEYQQRCTMLDSSGLDAMEKTAVRLRLKQQYLKKMRGIIQD